MDHTEAKMGKITILSQLIWLGLASAQITKLPLIRNTNDLDNEFAASLPPPQKYTLAPWPEDESKRFTFPLFSFLSFFLFSSSRFVLALADFLFAVKRGIPQRPEWGESLYEPKANFYCKDDFTIYNVTFPDVRIQFASSCPRHPLSLRGIQSLSCLMRVYIVS